MGRGAEEVTMQDWKIALLYILVGALCIGRVIAYLCIYPDYKRIFGYTEDADEEEV